MLRDLFRFWLDTAEAWHGGIFSNGIVGLGFLAWPAAVSFSLCFWSSIKKIPFLKWAALILDAVMLLVSVYLWNTAADAVWKEGAVALLSGAVFWLMGWLIYPIFWSGPGKRPPFGKKKVRSIPCIFI